MSYKGIQKVQLKKSIKDRPLLAAVREEPTQEQKKAAALKILFVLRKFRIYRVEFVKQLALKMIQSQIKIARSFRRYQIRKLLGMGLAKVRIYWQEYSLKLGRSGCPSRGVRVQLIGSFTNPSWQVLHELNYSSSLKAHYVDVIIPRDASFKFIVNDKYMTSSYYPILHDGGYANNKFFHLPKVNLPQVQLTSKSSPKIVKQISTNVEISQTVTFKKLITQNEVQLQSQQKYSNKNLTPNEKRVSDKTIVKPKIILNTLQEKRGKPKDKKSTPNPKTIYDVYDCNGDAIKLNQRAQIKKQIKQSNVQKSQSEISLTLSNAHSQHDSFNGEDDQYVFIGDAYNIPKNPKGPSEDAYFITEKGVGVSDGVGGWNSYGIDSSLFSNTLMKECQRFIQRIVFRQQQSIIDPRVTVQELECHRQALETSMESISSIPSSDSDNSLLSQYQPGGQRNSASSSSFFSQMSKHLCPTNILKFSLRRTHFPGSATATICVLNNRDMTALNLGDSGFILIRFDQLSNEPYILIRSKEQIHGFNTPYQLTRLPSQKEVDALRMQNKKKELENLKRALRERKFCEDSPEDSDIYQMRIREGDLLLLATDGVFDNLFSEEILTVVKNFTTRNTNLKTKASAHILARQIAEAAFQKSKKTNVRTPFQAKKNQLLIEQRKKLLQQHSHSEQTTHGIISHDKSNTAIAHNEYIKSLMKQEGIDENQIQTDENLGNLSYGKGKQDDITVAALWISHRHYHQQVQL